MIRSYIFRYTMWLFVKLGIADEIYITSGIGHIINQKSYTCKKNNRLF